MPFPFTIIELLVSNQAAERVNFSSAQVFWKAAMGANWLEQFAAQLAPRDFPSGSLRILWASELPSELLPSIASRCNGWMQDCGDVIYDIAAPRRQSIIVLDRAKLDESARLYDSGANAASRQYLAVALHELAHVIMFPAVADSPLSVEESAKIRADYRAAKAAAELESNGAALEQAFQAALVEHHGAGWARVLAHIYYRAWDHGREPFGDFGGLGLLPAALPALVAALGTEPEEYRRKSLRELASVPMPAPFAAFWPASPAIEAAA